MCSMWPPDVGRIRICARPCIIYTVITALHVCANVVDVQQYKYRVREQQLDTFQIIRVKNSRDSYFSKIISVRVKRSYKSEIGRDTSGNLNNFQQNKNLIFARFQFHDHSSYDNMFLSEIRPIRIVYGKQMLPLKINTRCAMPIRLMIWNC